MITENKPDVWMIVIDDHPSSIYYRDRVLPSWLNLGYRVNLFSAVTPKDLDKYSELSFFKKHNKKRDSISEFTDTEKAVWYSHFLLWKQCVEDNTPIIICEHDIELVVPIQRELFDNEMVCLSHDPPNDIKPRQTHLAGGAYYITPKVARYLISVKKKRVTFNSDSWIHNTCDKFGKWHISKCKQIKDPNVGVTVTHNK